jgi:hypothetical protein
MKIDSFALRNPETRRLADVVSLSLPSGTVVAGVKLLPVKNAAVFILCRESNSVLKFGAVEIRCEESDARIQENVKAAVDALARKETFSGKIRATIPRSYINAIEVGDSFVLRSLDRNTNEIVLAYPGVE